MRHDHTSNTGNHDADEAIVAMGISGAHERSAATRLHERHAVNARPLMA
jgi:hypothetical protein